MFNEDQSRIFYVLVEKLHILYTHKENETMLY